MKRTTRKLFVAAAALGLAAASTIGSTYAWFTINGEATASSLDMKVTSGAGIAVREHNKETETDYTTELTLAHAALTDATAITPASITDVTSWSIVNVADTIALQKSTYQTAYDAKIAEAKDSKNPTADEIAAAEAAGAAALAGGYDYALDALSDDEKAKSLFESTVDVKVTKGYDVAVFFTFTEGAATQAAKVMRIAFTYNGTTTTYRLVAHTETDDVATEAFKTTYSLENLNDNKSDDTNDITKVKVLGTDKASATKLITSTSTGNGYDVYEQIKVSVWYEGEDIECSNDIFKQQVAFNLSFIPVEHKA